MAETFNYINRKRFAIRKLINFDTVDAWFCYHQILNFSTNVTYVLSFNSTSGIKVYVEKLNSVETKMNRENVCIILHSERNIKKVQDNKSIPWCLKKFDQFWNKEYNTLVFKTKQCSLRLFMV